MTAHRQWWVTDVGGACADGAKAGDCWQTLASSMLLPLLVLLFVRLPRYSRTRRICGPSADVRMVPPHMWLHTNDPPPRAVHAQVAHTDQHRVWSLIQRLQLQLMICQYSLWSRTKLDGGLVCHQEAGAETVHGLENIEHATTEFEKLKWMMPSDRHLGFAVSRGFNELTDDYVRPVRVYSKQYILKGIRLFRNDVFFTASKQNPHERLPNFEWKFKKNNPIKTFYSSFHETFILISIFFGHSRCKCRIQLRSSKPNDFRSFVKLFSKTNPANVT